MSRQELLLAAALVLWASPGLAQSAKPVHVDARCYDPATGGMVRHDTSEILGLKPGGIVEFCTPWLDEDGDHYPSGEASSCTVTFFDQTVQVLPNVPVGAVGSFSLPKDGVAPVELTCVVLGLQSAVMRRTAQHPPFLPPVAPELLD